MSVTRGQCCGVVGGGDGGGGDGDNADGGSGGGCQKLLTPSSPNVTFFAPAFVSRNGQAVRLTYDHKGSDAQEAKRIMDLGGFVMNNRVNGNFCSLLIFHLYMIMFVAWKLAIEKVTLAVCVLAVTRSLGDSTMKEFVVGNPYTTETVLVENDPFLILACDGLWDVCDDQDAVDLIKDIEDPQLASEKLLEHALANYSTDNLSIMVVRFYHRDGSDTHAYHYVLSGPVYGQGSS
ncbi:hypothetical protein BC937DRAFT_95068 [Endogone sp. FLAS-F59071]|nr:hypothetical protein BC937DRAFT_95068 [Endogone sp. FLAS-F59071]|eukprot:RUS20498.1 hypothetical protein BC937DRAFT_95068 [Endogone sp. FLAS-F59071]